MKITPTTVLLGKVTNVNANGQMWTVPEFAWDGEAWQRTSSSDFEPDGSVFWRSAPSPTVGRGDVIAFTVVAGNDKHAWMGDRQVPCHPVVDRRSMTYGEVMRGWYTRPMHVTLRANTEAVFVACSDSITLGPVRGTVVKADRFELDTTQALDRLNAIRGDIPSVDLRTHETWMTGVIDPRSRFMLDCRSNSDVLRTALRDAVALLRQSGDVVPTAIESKNAIDRAVAIAEADGIDDTRLERLKRAVEIAANWESSVVTASVLADDLQKLPKIQRQIKTIEQNLRAEIRKRESAAIRQELSTETDRVARLRDEARQAEEKRDTALNDLSDLDGMVEQKISELSERSTEALADALLLRPLLSPTTNVAEPLAAEGSRQPTHQVAPVFRVNGEMPTSTDTSIFDTVAKPDSPSWRVLNLIHAGIRAGLLPVLSGAGARSAIAAYARVAVGDRRATIAVTHDFLQPVDLLGLRAESGELTRPHRDLLAAANEEVAATGGGLVTLDGFNRGAVESYLVPWLTDPAQAIALSQVEAAALGRPTFVRERNLLVIATAISGSTSAPVGRELWSNAISVDVPRWEGTPLADLARSAVSDTLQTPAGPNAKRIAKIEEGFIAVAAAWWQIDSGTLQSALRIARALMDNPHAKPSDREIVRSVAESVLVPAIAGDAECDLTKPIRSVAEWVAPGDGQYAHKLERRARRVRASIG